MQIEVETTTKTKGIAKVTRTISTSNRKGKFIESSASVFI